MAKRIKLAPKAGIELDENLTPQENAQKYYSQYKKEKTLANLIANVFLDRLYSVVLYKLEKCRNIAS